MEMIPTTSTSSFQAELYEFCVDSLKNYHEDNYDTFFRGEVPTEDPAHPENETEIGKAVDELAPYSAFYDLLKDLPSKKLLIELLAYRIMGFRKVKLSRNSEKYWKGIERAKALASNETPAMRIPFLTWPLLRFDTKTLGFDMKVFTYAEAIAINFVQKQYVLERPGAQCKVDAGDVVIDCGACWGDTSLQFACASGPNGHVHAFEFVPSNLEVFQRNLEINPELNKRISLVKNPVGSQPGKSIFFYENGPGSRLSDQQINERYKECTIESVDNLVESRNIEKVDFIKMDVEGSEMDALKGARKTIEKFRPKLAICIYHKPDDYLTIPKHLNDLNLDYDFHIDHHTIYLNETVLFGVPRSKA